MPGVPGCTEHHSKLAHIISEARTKHKALTVTWLDLANAYGSVNHALIEFSVKHYHAPPRFLSLLRSLYSGLIGKIVTMDWTTSVFPLDVGVYQGDPLSVVIFNTVINTLVDTLETRPDLGYTLSNTNHKVSVLQYADDTCICAHSPDVAQQLLDMTNNWLIWAGMRAKPSKCCTLAIAGSTGKLFNPGLFIGCDEIPHARGGPVKFLGLNIQIPKDSSASRQLLTARLKHMLQQVDVCPLTRHQKLRLYRAAICPRLAWLLMVEEFPITWLERELEALATKFLKKWSGLARPANTALLYLPSAMGGLNLPALSSLYKRLQISRQCQLLTSADSCVRHIAEHHLKEEDQRLRKKFKPVVFVRDVMAEDPGRPRKSLCEAAKRKVSQEDNTDRHNNLVSLQRQGQMLSNTAPDAASVWAKAIEVVTSDQCKFVVNAAVDTLPHNANLHLWKKKKSAACPLCGEHQTLIHVLNCCSVARDLRRYNSRHDGVLRVVLDTIKPRLKPTTQVSADIDDNYIFPTHIVPTDLRPDIVWWNEVDKTLVMVELTIAFETSFEGATQRKTVKYDDLVKTASNNGFDATLITIEVGSRGIINLPGFKELQHVLSLTRRECISMLVNSAVKAIGGSFVIWANRNTMH